MSNKIFAEIIVDNRSRSTDMSYTYLIPTEYAHEVQLGMRVLVPFGMGDRLLEGIIIAFKENSSFAVEKLKYIDSIIDKKPIISKNMLDLALWMKDEYLAQYTEVFKTILPSGITNKVKIFVKLVSKRNFYSIEDQKNNNENKIILFLKENGDSEIKYIRDKLSIRNIHKHLTFLEEQGIIRKYEKIVTDVKKKYHKVIYRNFDKQDIDDIVSSMSKNAHKQIEVLRYLIQRDKIPLKQLLDDVSASKPTIGAIEKKGYVKLLDEEIRRNPISKSIPEYKKVKLTLQQQKCFDTIYNDITLNRNNKFLLHGVTGS